ncbi:MAG: twin-arginine translocase TatA/TatE family subunit [Planctomycetota bacterium]|jgi:sec-independent protein translocase protein TatA|nr:twin-arginine translocase TatA/TatE family subunit [Planctomycetota bacterium]MDP6940624.1 twin-arginine translocase TatA/TatE family subunit [Planctomycetota bacterium]
MKIAHRLLASALLLGLPACAVGPSEMWPIALVALLLFGGAKLPSLMRSMGSGINEFKKGLKDGESSKEENNSSDGDSKSDEEK